MIAEAIDWSLVAGIALIPLAGLFAALDAALSTVSIARVDELERDGRPGARRLQALVQRRAQYVNLTVLLYTICIVAAAVQVITFFEDLLRSSLWGLTLGVIVMTILAFVVAGVGPRTLGRQHAYSIALAGAMPLRLLGIVLRPIVRLLIVLGNVLTPGGGFRNGPFSGEIELLEIVDLARERGVVAEGESRMIQSVFELDQTTAREVMTPRTEMVWIEGNKSVAQTIRLAVRSGHSRIPVIGDSVDEILGVVYLRDLVREMTRDSEAFLTAETKPVTTVMREPHFEPDVKAADALLAQMQARRNHITILIDEYGGVAGLVTIEDILEEIVGEIRDEHDTTEVAPITDLGDGEYRLSARLSLDEVAELFDVEFDEETRDEADTVAGLLAYELGRVPLPGTRVKTAGLEFHAEGGADRRGRIRVTTVCAHRTEVSPVPQEPASDD